MKKLDAKSWIIIGASVVIMGGVVGLSYYNYKKAESEAQLMVEHNYAEQTVSSVEESTISSETTTNPNVDPMLSEYLSTFDNSYIDPEYAAQVDGDADFEVDRDPNSGDNIDTSVLYFNIVEDANYDNSLIDMDTISIDGHVVDFPSTYEEITNTFGELHSLENQDYLPTDTVSGEIIVGYNATTGVGRVDFIFTTDGETKLLSDCRCIGVQLSTFNYDEEAQNMTISLPGNVHFGDSYEEARDKFPLLYDEHNSTNGDWFIRIEDQGITYNLFGQGQMNMALITFE